ncbi:MAG: ABC transporter substrate-binding protein [Chloroflexi bacterium]|nr:ABC transporter substrate-binding protein [Chloroflexota bacterium]
MRGQGHGLRHLVLPWSLLLVALAAGACGEAAQPAATPTRPPAVAATPTTAPTATPTTAPAVVATPTRAPTATPTPAGVQPKYGGVAAFAHRGDPSSWDSMFDTNVNTTLPDAPIFGDRALLKPCRNNSFQLCPYLAESWESNSEATVWTFKVREGVFWHDGKALAADDIKWWLELLINGAPGGRPPAKQAATLGPVQGIEVVGGSRLRITLLTPVVQFPALLSSPNLSIQHPRHLMQSQIEKGNGTVAPNEVGWVGTGPFKMAKYDKGVVIRVRKFDRYWEKDEQGRQLPFLDGIDFVIMTEGSSVFAAFRTGRLHRTAVGEGFYLVPQQREIIKREFGDQAWIAKYPPFGSLTGINASKPPMSDVRVRQAVSMWLDRNSYIRAVYNGDGEPAAVFAPGSPYANPGFIEWPGWNPKTKEQDRKRARELLAEAGYPTGFKATVLARAGRTGSAEWLVGDLAGLLGEGNLRIAAVDSATYTNRICQGDFDLIQPVSAGVIDRDSPELLAAGYSSKNRCSYVKHNDEKVDKAFERIAATRDDKERVRLAQELERYLSIETWLAVNMSVEAVYVAYKSEVNGWPVPQWNPTNNGDYATTWLAR